MVGERIIERSIYPELVAALKEIQFEKVLGEAEQGTARKFTDVTFSYKDKSGKDKKFLAEVKFGDINNETPRAKDQSQARGYAERKETRNYMLLI